METRIGFINRTYRHINRYWDIVTTLFKHGFDEVFKNIHLARYIDFGKKKFPEADKEKIKPLSIWERIRLALEDLGPTFIKFGQIMSNRPDLLPPELLVELEKLQDSVPPFSDKEAIELVESELGKPVTELFLEFDSTPFASASIAQAHKATLKTGEKVVLKVQRPDIESTIKVDIEIITHLAAIIEKHVPGADNFDPVGIVEEFKRTINKEINFHIEASNIEKFAENFEGEPTIYVPRVYREYTTPKVLTLEFVDGVKISRIEEVIDDGNDPRIIAKRGANLVLKQIFEHGFFHADPHPGNILVLKDNIICFIDFGMMGTLHPKHRDHLAKIIIGVVNKDGEKIARTLLELAGQDEIDDYISMEKEVMDMVDQYSHLPLKDINISEFLTETIQLVLKYKLKIPPDIYVLSKAMITIEGVARKLDPEFDMISHISPFAKKLMLEPLKPSNLINDMFKTLKEFLLLLHDFPTEIKEISQQIKRGKVKVEIEHKGLDPMLKKHDQISNRVAFAIVLASLIIGSSLIVLSGIPPIWNGIPIIGIVGFVGAGLMGFWLLISILRHGRM